MKSTTTRNPRRPILGKAAAAVVALTAVSAWATDYSISGSDTVYDILTRSMKAWKNDPDTTTPHNLIYLGGGSGTAENAMTRRVDGGISPTQSIGGMSRNFRESFIGDPAYGLAPPAPWNTAPMLVPEPANVIALDAVVVVETNRIKACDNLRIAMDPTDITHEHAAVDNPLALILGGKSYEPPRCSVAAPGQLLGRLCNPTVLVDAGVGVAVPDCEAPTAAFPSGEGSCVVGAEGTIAACRDPARMQALRDFNDCFDKFGATITLTHFLRRDDNSGTTDTMKERLRIKRFCNGVAKPASPTPVGANLLAEDLDPVRRPVADGPTTCMGTSAATLATSCTNSLDGTQCGNQASPPATCTQGFVVALSEFDPGSSDVTVSIANRVGDLTMNKVGYAGKEAARAASHTTNVKINGLNPEPTLVRLGQYFLSRRLYLQSGYAAADAVRNEIEADFLDWATTRNGHCNTDQFAKDLGFITCMDNCGASPPPSNLCGAAPFRPAEIVAQACAGNAGASCAAGNMCCTGEVCPASGVCPASAAKGAGFQCNPARPSDCVAPLQCVNNGYDWDYTCQ